MHQARLQRRVVGAELGAEGAPSGLDPQRVDGVVAAVPQAEIGAGRRDLVVDMRRHLRRHVELAAELADVAHARGADAREPDIDLAREADREGGVGERIGRHPRQQRRGIRPHHRQRRPRRRHVVHRHERVADMAPQPVGIAHAAAPSR